MLEDGLANFSVKNIEFTNFSRVFSHKIVGITLQQLEFDNVIFSNTASAIFLSANIEEAWVTNSSFTNIVSDGSTAGSAVMMGFKNNDSSQISEDSGRIHISNNNFTGLKRTAGNLEFHAILVRGNQAIVSHNIIRDFSCNEDNSCEAIYAHANKTIVSNNSLSNIEGAAAILLKGNSVGSGQHQVKSNIISNYQPINQSIDAAVAAIEIQVSNTFVSQNSIYESSGYAILENYGSKGSQITNNYIYKPQANVIKARSSDTVISGNTILRPSINRHDGQVKIINIIITNNEDLNNLIIRDNNISIDNELTTKDLFVIFLQKYSTINMSNIIITNNIFNNLGQTANISSRFNFVLDKANTNDKCINNIVIGLPNLSDSTDVCGNNLATTL